MKDSYDHPPRSNPFSTRFIRPGAIAYLFPPGQTAAGLVERLRESGWRGQIVGPHGSGKSTLLAALAEPLIRAQRRSWTVGLRDGARRMPAGWVDQARLAASNLIVIDGYEQLSAASRFAVKTRCRWNAWGLLVTAHQDVGFPTLATTSSSLETAQVVVERLLSERDSQVTPEWVDECFAASGGEVRETLFRLYDRWESLPA